MEQIKYKVKSKKTGVIYFPSEVEILISPFRVVAHDLNGIEIGDPEFFPFVGRVDSNKQDIFEGDNLLLEYEGDQGHITDKVTVKKRKGAYYLFNKSNKQAQAIRLFIVPHEMKLTLWKST